MDTNNWALDILNIKDLFILVVEDNDQDYLLLQRQINKTTGVRLLRVATIADAELVLTEKNVNLVLLDLSLPDSQGLDTVSQIVKQSSAPVVVLTGTDDERLGLNALNRGAQDYLVKGKFDIVLLARSIRYAVERYSLIGKLNESRELIRRNRELRRLSRISEGSSNTPRSNSLNAKKPLKSREADRFDNAVASYSRILNSAIEQRGFKVDNQVPARLKKLARNLSDWRATPQDVVDVHTSVLKKHPKGMETEKIQVRSEEARYLLIGLLGHLCSYYSDQHHMVQDSNVLAISASNDADIETS
ncbi:MAG: response regulator [Granulosicoccus sp.]|nr:response regulator [Granulosicoccus sp.]